MKRILSLGLLLAAGAVSMAVAQAQQDVSGTPDQDVSAPTSPFSGTLWNVHISLPVRTS